MATASSARVLRFHVDADQMTDVAAAMDAAAGDFAALPGFGGLLGLVDDSPRPQVLMISLWDAQGLRATAAEGEEARRRIAEIADTGVTSRVLSVLCFSEVPSLRGDAEL
ncbi:MAG: hypothetical protein ABSG81_12280 [Acidimicrobiales bacterium]|jgi:hypothetical protein